MFMGVMPLRDNAEARGGFLRDAKEVLGISNCSFQGITMENSG